MCLCVVLHLLLLEMIKEAIFLIVSEEKTLYIYNSYPCLNQFQTIDENFTRRQKRKNGIDACIILIIVLPLHTNIVLTLVIVCSFLFHYLIDFAISHDK